MHLTNLNDRPSWSLCKSQQEQHNASPSSSSSSSSPSFNFWVQTKSPRRFSNMGYLGLYLLQLLLFVSFFGAYRADLQDSVIDISCALVNCGEGVCKASNGTLLGFDCECNPGWKKLQIGPMSFPSCIIPNCNASRAAWRDPSVLIQEGTINLDDTITSHYLSTIDFTCDSSGPSPPPPPPSSPTSVWEPHILDPCALIWCGDGRCITNGTGHMCICNEGSANLLNMTALACFKQCYFGADCSSLGLRLGSPPPSPSSNDLSTNGISPSSNVSVKNGSSEVSICSRNQQGLLPLLSAILLWI